MKCDLMPSMMSVRCTAAASLNDLHQCLLFTWRSVSEPKRARLESFQSYCLAFLRPATCTLSLVALLILKSKILGYIMKEALKKKEEEERNEKNWPGTHTQNCATKNIIQSNDRLTNHVMQFAVPLYTHQAQRTDPFYSSTIPDPNMITMS